MMNTRSSRMVWVGKSGERQQVRVELELIVDPAAIFDKLAEKAAKNKSGKAKILGGAVMVRVVDAG